MRNLAPSRSQTNAWRIRTASAAGAFFTVLVLRSVVPAGQTEQGSYLFVTTFGYGHLLGASIGSRRHRAAEDTPSKFLRTSLVVTSLASIYAAFTGVLAAAPWVVLPMLYASIWHIVENDVAIQRSYHLGLPALPFPRSLDQHLLAAALTGLVAVLAARAAGAPAFDGIPAALEVGTYLMLFAPGLLLFVSKPRTLHGQLALGAVVLTGLLAWHGAPWLRFWEVFAAVTCYHLIEWLLVVGDKARERSLTGQSGDRRRAAYRTLGLHLPAVVLCVVAFAGGDSMAWLRSAFSPAGYLLFSLLHVAHTAAIRLRNGQHEQLARAAA